MNIGQLIRSVAGDLHVSDAKALELKVGQVVRGVILQMMSEQDALVGIGGVPVRARLETPMAQGRATLLQVQPESTSGQVVLKPLESSGVQIAEKSLPDLLKDFGMKNTSSNRRAMQELHLGQAPLVKETVQAYAEATAHIPEGVDESQWREAALLAVKRGLPVTEETVGALQRTLFGKPMDQSLQAFRGMVMQALNADGEAALPQPVRELLAQVRQVLEALPQGPEAAKAAAKAAPADAAPAAASTAGGREAGSAGDAGVRGEPAGRGAAAGAPAQQAAAPTGEAAAAARGAGGAAPAEPGAAAAGRSGAAPDAGAGAGSARGAAVPQAAPDGAGPRSGDAAVGGGARRAHAPAAADGGRPAAAQQAPPPEAGGGAMAAPAQGQQEPAPWVGRLLKALGVEHEQQLARPHERGGSMLPPHSTQADDGTASSAQGTAAPQPSDAAQKADTLKGLLLQLSATDEAPAAIRESAQQLVQQITGQQLLLTPDRASMFTHMTLMLPLMNGDGSQTAAIHIQSRKGQRGELDATNCRLLFDLNMRSLGSTLVDVQVTERIVSLRIHNDLPVIGELLEQHRDEIKAGLEGIGYQFLSLKVLPYPERVPAGDDPSSGSAQSAPGTGSPVFKETNLYHAKPYKGVDLRV